jgi:hypothetical protein
MTESTGERLCAAVELVLAHAERDPHGPLPYEDLPEVYAVFPNRRELLMALQWSWTRELWAHIATHARAGTSHAGSVAWTECAERNQALRRLLDRYGDELAAPRAESRVVRPERFQQDGRPRPPRHSRGI